MNGKGSDGVSVDVFSAALACVRAVDEALDYSESLRVGRPLLPGQREAFIADIVAAHMTQYALIVQFAATTPPVPPPPATP